ELVMGVTGGLKVLYLGIGNPGRVGFANALVLMLFSANPFGAPFFGVEEARFPPACVAGWICLAILVPNFYTPKITLLRGQCGTRVTHTCRLIRFHAAAIPNIGLAHAEKRGVGRNFNLKSSLPRPKPSITQLPGKHRLLRIEPHRVYQRITFELRRFCRWRLRKSGLRQHHDEK